MKALLAINQIAFYTTVALFITIFLGLFAQIPLGLIQLISAVMITIKYYKSSSFAEKSLNIYWIIAIIELYLLCVMYNSISASDSAALSLFAYFLFPMGIATYFLVIAKKIIKENENIS
jgi:ABC-type antimicrobial peptide transport system permease subunit